MEFDELKFFTGFTEFDYPSRFAECKNLVSINLSNIVKISGYNGYQRYGFENCTSLKNVVINPAMTEIGFQAFLNCTSLEEIDLRHIKTIYANAFKGSGVKDVDMTNVETIGEGAFIECKNLNIEINLPNLKGTLGNSAFSGLSITKIASLGSVSIIGTGTNSYGWGPFKNCENLLEVILPTTVTNIGWGAFNNCSALRFIKILAAVPPALSTNVFDNTNNCPLYVPAASVAAYKTATNWSNYASRIQAIID